MPMFPSVAHVAQEIHLSASDAVSSETQGKIHLLSLEDAANRSLCSNEQEKDNLGTIEVSLIKGPEAFSLSGV